MIERPIIFNPEMVRAIIEGRKTQTRRMLKKQPVNVDINPLHMPNEWGAWNGEYPSHGKVITCPYGKPGDRLWVRETWCPLFSWDRDTRQDYEKQAIYKASPKEAAKKYGNITNGRGQKLIDNIKWKPSIHMPRWASRINLQITKVRVERLHDIRINWELDDVRAEGIEGEFEFEYQEFDAFEDLWNKIDGPNAWGKNPWVWVIEFKKI